MREVGPPARMPAPPRELGRLGVALGWLGGAQGSWPPHPPAQCRTLEVGTGGLAAGIATADALVDGGADPVGVGAPAANCAAYVALCVLLDVEPVVAVGTTVGAGWSELVVAV